MNHVNQNAQGLRYLALDSIFSFPDLLATMLQKHPKSYFDHYNSIMSYQYSQNIAKPNKKSCNICLISSNQKIIIIIINNSSAKVF